MQKTKGENKGIKEKSKKITDEEAPLNQEVKYNRMI